MQNPIPIQKLIDDELQKKQMQRSPRKPQSWYASSLGICPTGAYLKRQGEEPDEKLDARTLRVFSMGNQIEDWIGNLLRASPELYVEEQVRVESKRFGVTGYTDFVISHINNKNEKKVYEVKSKNSRAFWWMDKKGQGANRQHMYQTWLYMYELRIKEGNVIYISKDDMSILEYPVYLNDIELEEEVTDWTSMMNEAWEKQEPFLLPFVITGWLAKYCSHHKQCKKIFKGRFKNIEELKEHNNKIYKKYGSIKRIFEEK